MNKLLIALCTGLLLVNNVQAKEIKDPFDTSATDKKIKELGVPTISSVDAMEKKAKDLFLSGNCKSAVTALDKYAKTANHLANIISAGLDPYYGADYDDRKYFSGVKQLAVFEQKSNDYKAKRNRARVMQGECLAKLGKKNESVSVLIGALDLIDIDDREWWERARKALYEQIGYK